MLVHLSIHNYAIVDHLDLELDAGMSAISGETGAGKSIMLDALGLALGDRADSGVVRPGADKADILASFDLEDIAEARAWLAERDLDNDGRWDFDAGGSDRDIDNDGRWDYDKGGSDRDLDNDKRRD